jgi:heparosan-N-sulfate-glucuronate 5-epimerase
MRVSRGIFCITRITASIVTIIIIIIFSPYAYDRHSNNNIIGLAPITALAEPVADDYGVIKYNYPSLHHSVYNPLILASGGLSYFTEYQDTGDSQSKQYFINTANWLVNNAIDKEQGRYSIWEYDFTWPWYGGITPPYYSAYTQAVGTVVLAHAYDLTGNEVYIDEANKAFQALLVDYDSGGATTIEDHGNSVFFHELAKPGFQKTYILNGHTGSLLHIWQYYQLTHDPQAMIIFDKGINYLKHNLRKYDTGSWSLYDQTVSHHRKTNFASEAYHKIHIDHLKRLYSITGEPILKKYADRFTKYLDNRIGLI